MWNIHGVVSPIAEGENGGSQNRSPYLIDIVSFVSQFAFSSERITILLKLLDYRQAIYRANIDTGFQWINGSFTEDVERLRNRPPNDIDLVTFIHDNNIEPNEQWVESHSYIFNNEQVKDVYNVDSYWVNMDEISKPQLAKYATYWYSMWSHQRVTNIWKGFYQISLTPQDDIIARQWLDSITAGDPNE